MPGLRARALRRRLASALLEARPAGPDDALRDRALLLDAGAPIPAALPSTPRGAANLAGDPALGARARASWRWPTAAARRRAALARANAIRGHFQEAEADPGRDRRPSCPGTRPAVAYLEQRVARALLGLRPTPRRRARSLDRAQAWCGRRALAAPAARAARCRPPCAADLAGAIAATEAALLADPGLPTRSAGCWRRGWRSRCSTRRRWTESCALARRHCPEIPIRDYTGLMTLRALPVRRRRVRRGLARAGGRSGAHPRRRRPLPRPRGGRAGRGRHRLPWSSSAGASRRARWLPRPSCTSSARTPSAWSATCTRAAGRDRRPGTGDTEGAPARSSGCGAIDGAGAAAASRRCPTSPAPRAGRRARAIPNRAPRELLAAAETCLEAAGLHRAAGLRALLASRRPGRGRSRPLHGRAARRAARRDSSPPTPRTRPRSRAATGPALLTAADEFAAIGARRYAMRRRGARGDALRGRRAPGLGTPRGRARRRPARAGPGSEPARESTGSTRWPWRSPRARASSSEFARRGPQQRGDRRSARALGPHRGDAPVPRDAEARRQRPAGAVTAAGRPLTFAALRPGARSATRAAPPTSTPAATCSAAW